MSTRRERPSLTGEVETVKKAWLAADRFGSLRAEPAGRAALAWAGRVPRPIICRNFIFDQTALKNAASATALR